MPPPLRKILRGGLIVLAAIITLIFAAGIVFISPPVQERLTAWVASQISDQVTGTVRIGSLRTNLINRISLYSLTAHDAGNPGDSVRIGRITVTYSLFPLLKKTVEIRQITIVDASLSAHRGADGTLFFPLLPSPGQKPADTQPSPWSINIGSIRLDSIDVAYQDSLLPLSAHLGDIAALADFHRLDSVSVELRSGTGAARSPWWHGRFVTIETRTTFSPVGLMIDTARFVADSTTLTGRGFIPLQEKGVWDLAATVSTYLSPLVVLDSPDWFSSSERITASASWQGLITAPRLNLTLAAKNSRVHDLVLDTLRLAAYYEPSGELAGRLRIDSRYGSLEASTRLQIPSLLTGPVIRSYEASLTAPSLDVQALMNNFGVTPDALPKKMPRYTASLKLSAAGNRFDEIPVSLTSRLILSTAGSKDARVSLDLQDAAWRLNAMLGPGNILTGRGSVGTKLDDLDGNVSLALLNPSFFSSLFGQPAVRGTAALEGTIGGTLASPALRVALSSDTLAWQGVTVSDLFAMLFFADGRFSFDDLKLEMAARLDSLLPRFGVDDAGGTLSLSASGKGSPEHPVLRTRFAIEQPLIGGFEAEKIEGEGSLINDTIAWPRLHIVKGEATMSAEGHAVLTESFIETTLDLRHNEAQGRVAIVARLQGDSLNASIVTRRFNPAALNPWSGMKLPESGTVSLTARIAGPTVNPEASLELSFRQPISLDNVATGSLNAALRDSLVTGSLKFDAEGRSRPLIITANMPVLPSAPWSIDRTIRDGATVTVEGPEVHMAQALRQLVPRLEADTVTLAIDGTMAKRSDRWSIEGSTRLAAYGIVDSSRSLSGDSLTARVAFDGSLASPLLDFEGRAASASWEGRKLQGIGIDGRFARDTLFLDTLRGHAGSGTISLAGTVPVSAFAAGGTGSAMEFTLEAVPLSLAGRLTDAANLREGTLDGRGRIFFGKSRPIIEGELRIHKAVADVTDVEPAIGPIDAKLTATGSRLIVDSLAGEIGSAGRFSGNGEMALTAPFRGSFVLEGRNIRMETADLDLGIDVISLQLTDSASAMVLGGQIDLGSTRYSTFISPLLLIERLKSRPKVDIRRTEADPLPLYLRTVVALRQNLTIETNIGEFLLDGRVTVLGQPSSPGVVGAVNVVEGFVYYLDRTFEIKRAVLRLTSPDAIRPAIDLQAHSEVIATEVVPGTNDVEDVPYTITLTITGDLTGPSVSLAASPFLHQEQIISLLTLGTTRGYLGSGTARRVEAVLAQQLAGLGTRKLEQLLDIERLSLNLAGEEASVTAVKRLSPRLSLAYQTSLQDLAEPRITATYRLLPFLYLVGKGDYAGNGGIDLHIRFSR